MTTAVKSGGTTTRTYRGNKIICPECGSGEAFKYTLDDTSDTVIVCECDGDLLMREMFLDAKHTWLSKRYDYLLVHEPATRRVVAALAALENFKRFATAEREKICAELAA